MLATLRRVLWCNTVELTVEAEGGCTFADVCEATLGLPGGPFLPAVLPDVPSITVGGAVAGLAYGSTSSTYGMFHQTVTVGAVE